MPNTTWETILTETLGAFLTGKLSFTVHGLSVNIASVSGTPVKFTLATAIFAAESIFLGSTGELQVGNVLVTIAPVGTASSNASPAAAAIASAIAASVTPSGAAPVTPDAAPLYPPVSYSAPVTSSATLAPAAIPPASVAPAVAPASVPAGPQVSGLQPGPAGYTVHHFGHTAP